jgi:hypothetical protein
MSTEHKGWIGVDLDGTLAHYDGWKGIEHIGEPIAPMVARVKQWLAEGVDVRIFTARIAGRDALTVENIINRWLLKHVGQMLPVTNIKTMSMIELWDDRAVCVERNTGRILGSNP